MRKLMLACTLFILSYFPAMAGTVTAIVDKTDQTMIVLIDGSPTYTWDVSTGAKYGWTPTGTFGVQSMSADHYSSKYNNAPMPHSIFFNGNIATHGTDKVDRLGQMDSKGCVRLHRDHAKILFNLVLAHGRDNTTIIVQD
jgi:lipoprotein-anchoring transpeptidase ErfK/SrfK